jgi:glycosyltransferase involved in cell wall biosynthesis
MKPKVAHFIRKQNQYYSSFIYNQISNHENFSPIVIYATSPANNDSGRGSRQINDFQHYYCGGKRTFLRELIYKYLRLISKKESGEIISFLKANDVKMLHFHYGTDAAIYYRVIKEAGIPALVSFYGYDCSEFPKRFMGIGRQYLVKRVFGAVTKMTAMTQDMKNDLVKLGADENKIIIHYHGVNVKKFFVKDRKYDQKELIVILIVGSLVPKKGHLFLLHSIKELVKEPAAGNFILRIVGDGPLKGMLMNYVEKEGLTERVKFVGGLPYGESALIYEYINADIFVHPSVTDSDGDKEGIPGTAVEAMSAGLPVVSTYHAGIPYIIRHGHTGLLVKEGDVESLKAEILKLIKSASVRETIGRNGQQYALDELNLREKEKQLEVIYEHIISDFSI